MAYKTVITSIAAVALTLTPTLATAHAVRTTAVQPAAEEVEGNELRRRGFVIPLVILVAIVLSIILLTAANGGDDNPRVSP